MTTNQLNNLIEYFVLMNQITTQNVLRSRGILLDSPDYVLDKFEKYFGKNMTALPVAWSGRKFETMLEKEKVQKTLHEYYNDYCLFWGVMPDDPILRNIFILCMTEFKFKTFGKFKGGIEDLMKCFGSYFTGEPTDDRYSYLNPLLKMKVFDKMVAQPDIARALKISTIL